jgi:hypothetical protein
MKLGENGTGTQPLKEAGIVAIYYLGATIGGLGEAISLISMVESRVSCLMHLGHDWWLSHGRLIEHPLPSGSMLTSDFRLPH